MREKLMRFMQGRYGADAFTKCLMVLIVVSMVFAMILKSDIFYVVSLVLLVYSYFRMFSKNHNKRYAENQKYLAVFNTIKYTFQKEKGVVSQKKTHHIYKCPACKQKIRVPKGKGKIMIKCPKCNKEFLKKS